TRRSFHTRASSLTPRTVCSALAGPVRCATDSRCQLRWQRRLGLGRWHVSPC
ncbi:uncharacterized protein METZ01_LOCUS219973, partial [marine metagenome]